MSAPGAAPPDLSVVIACYNEEPHLETSVLEILATLESWRGSAELVFVEDCSTDGTRRVLEEVLGKHGGRMPMRAILHERNTGRGRAVADGLRAATGHIAGFLDIDLEVHARYLPAFARAIAEGADVAIARRTYHVALTPGFLLRHALSRGYHGLVRRTLGIGNWDTEAGYKFFARERILPVLERCQDPGWFWDTEVMALAERAGLRIVELPCLFVRRTDKRSTLRVLPAIVDYARKLVAFRRRLAAGERA